MHAIRGSCKEYTFADADGFHPHAARPLHVLRGDAALIEGLVERQIVRASIRGKALSRKEFDDHWPIIKQDLGCEEAVRLIERAKREGEFRVHSIALPCPCALASQGFSSCLCSFQPVYIGLNLLLVVTIWFESIK